MFLLIHSWISESLVTFRTRFPFLYDLITPLLLSLAHQKTRKKNFNKTFASPPSWCVVRLLPYLMWRWRQTKQKKTIFSILSTTQTIFCKTDETKEKNKNRTKTRENYKYERHREKFKEHGKSSTKCKPVVKSTIDWKYSTGCDNDFRLFRITFTSQRACGNIMKCLALVWFSNNNK